MSALDVWNELAAIDDSVRDAIGSVENVISYAERGRGGERANDILAAARSALSELDSVLSAVNKGLADVDAESKEEADAALRAAAGVDTTTGTPESTDRHSSGGSELPGRKPSVALWLRGVEK